MSDLLCFYGVHIKTATDMNKLLEIFLVDCSAEDKKDIEDEWNLENFKFPSDFVSDFEAEVEWIAGKWSLHYRSTSHKIGGCFIGLETHNYNTQHILDLISNIIYYPCEIDANRDKEVSESLLERRKAIDIDVEFVKPSISQKERVDNKLYKLPLFKPQLLLVPNFCVCCS